MQILAVVMEESALAMRWIGKTTLRVMTESKRIVRSSSTM